MVVLHADAPALGELADRELRREVARVEVVDDPGRLEIEQALEVSQVRFEGAVRQQVFEIAGVGSDVGAPAAGEGEGVLELGAHGEKRLGRRDRQVERIRRVAAAAPDQALPPVDDSRHRVVVAGADLAVVGQERVGDTRQPLQRLGVVRGQRFVGKVAARQDDRPAQALEQQVVQRRVGQEQPHAAIQSLRAPRLRVHHAVGERCLAGPGAAPRARSGGPATSEAPPPARTSPPERALRSRPAP